LDDLFFEVRTFGPIAYDDQDIVAAASLMKCLDQQGEVLLCYASSRRQESPAGRPAASGLSAGRMEQA